MIPHHPRLWCFNLKYSETWKFCQWKRDAAPVMSLIYEHSPWEMSQFTNNIITTKNFNFKTIFHKKQNEFCWTFLCPHAIPRQLHHNLDHDLTCDLLVVEGHVHPVSVAVGAGCAENTEFPASVRGLQEVGDPLTCLSAADYNLQITGPRLWRVNWKKEGMDRWMNECCTVLDTHTMQHR